MAASECPARLHVLLAREAPVGVVFRRGPSKHVGTWLWDRRSDEFHPGQWLKGRISARRADLSPDGRHLIYFALNGKRRGEAKGSWTAVSRAPYLKALALYAKGDAWHGGGLFTGPGRYWLNEGDPRWQRHDLIRDSDEVRRDIRYAPPGGFGGESPGVYYPRLLRDGWRLVAGERSAGWHNQSVFEKPAPGGWALRKVAHEQLDPPAGDGCYWDEHALVRPGRTIPCPGWRWAEVDGDRLAWAEAGRLRAGHLDGEGLTRQVDLRDFNPDTFARAVAPY